MVAHWGGYSYGSKGLTMQDKRRYRRRLRRKLKASISSRRIPTGDGSQ